MPKLNAYLNQIGHAFLRPKGQMGDWQHAARTFVDDYFRLAPKAKFLYHVYFDINSSAVLMPQLTQRHRVELGLLVKSVDLPRFNVRTQTVNQYNRKKVVQLTHDFGPMTFRFIDDRAHIVNMMWQSYYKYYYADSVTAEVTGAYERSAYKGYNYIRGPHGFDNNSTIPFFNEITLYQINKREFVSYTLINPLIQSFTHDQVSSSDQGGVPAECQMTINFEAVKYNTGTVESGQVKGFGQDHYDRSPSPLSPLGGGSRNIFGVGGVFDGVGTVLDQAAKGDYLGAAIGAINTYQNAKNINKQGAKQELTGIAVAAAIGGAGAILSGGLGSIKVPLPNKETKTDATLSNVNLNQPAGGGV
ncbi:MAG: hypothetical protein EBT86_03490 [Actinobacteria bacterium]|nr:hypothetical protein [Actinomycetota bacterium]